MADPANSDVYAYLAKVFRELFHRDDIVLRPHLTAADVVGWDSLKQVEIILSLQEAFDIRIRTREVINLSNLGELVELVQQKRAEAGR